jgi:hypothetical protein
MHRRREPKPRVLSLNCRRLHIERCTTHLGALGFVGLLAGWTTPSLSTASRLQGESFGTLGHLATALSANVCGAERHDDIRARVHHAVHVPREHPLVLSDRLRDRASWPPLSIGGWMLWTDKVGWGLVALDVAVDETMRTSPGPGSTSARAAASLGRRGLFPDNPGVGVHRQRGRCHAGRTQPGWRAQVIRKSGDHRWSAVIFPLCAPAREAKLDDGQRDRCHDDERGVGPDQRCRESEDNQIAEQVQSWVTDPTTRTTTGK